MPRVEAEQPGALASQWVPVDPELWRLDRYPDFLKERQRLLADATNDLLDSLWNRTTERSPLPPAGLPTLARPVMVVEDDPDDLRDREVGELLDWLRESGYAEAERDVEVAHPATGEVLAIAEAFWPNGLQEGLGDPVVLELDPEMADLRALEGLGMAVFTSCRPLREFVDRRRQEQLGAAGEDPVEPVEEGTVRSMTARSEILVVARRLASSSADGTFTVDRLVREMASAGTRFAESTIRTEVVSRMCANAPGNHATTYDDFVRVDHGVYRFR